MKFIITRAAKSGREEAVFTAHEERPRSLHGIAAFLSLQSREKSQAGSAAWVSAAAVSQACLNTPKTT